MIAARRPHLIDARLVPAHVLRAPPKRRPRNSRKIVGRVMLVAFFAFGTTLLLANWVRWLVWEFSQ